MKLSELKVVNENIDLDEYIKFREIVKNNMEYPDWLGDFTREDLEEMIKNRTRIWIYYLGSDPVCSMMLIPATEKSVAKFELDLDYTIVVDYGPMFVNPKYVGNSLQYQMLVELDKYSLNKGYKVAAATIHPDNIFSIRNFLKDKFKYTKTKEFKRGIRNIYIKNLK